MQNYSIVPILSSLRPVKPCYRLDSFSYQTIKACDLSRSTFWGSVDLSVFRLASEGTFAEISSFPKLKAEGYETSIRLSAKCPSKESVTFWATEYSTPHCLSVMVHLLNRAARLCAFRCTTFYTAGKPLHRCLDKPATHYWSSPRFCWNVSITFPKVI